MVGARDACASKNITLVEFLHYIDTHCATPWTIICLRYASILVNLSIREQDLNEDKNIKTGLQLLSMFGTRRNVEYSTTKRYSGSPSRAGVVNEARAQIFFDNQDQFLAMEWAGREGHHHSKGKEFLMSWDEKVVTSWRLFVLGGQRLICSRF